MRYEITNQKDLRRLFWRENPGLNKRKIKNYEGTGLMYQTDTRAAFIDFIDQLCRDGRISVELAQRVTL